MTTKKYVILFSDGEPSDSNDKTETEASAVKLKEAGCTVITVGLGLNNETDHMAGRGKWRQPAVHLRRILRRS